MATKEKPVPDDAYEPLRPVTRRVLCVDCKGQGMVAIDENNPGNKKVCPKCKGFGYDLVRKAPR